MFAPATPFDHINQFIVGLSRLNFTFVEILPSHLLPSETLAAS